MTTQELKAKIEQANMAYRSGEAIMSDETYDNLLESYQKEVSETEFKLFQNTLHEVKGKVKHPFILGSLDKLKADEPDTVYSFCEKNNISSLNVSAKVDGISCRLEYKDGKLVSASTRGDGTFGEDITDKIWYVMGVPHEIKGVSGNINIRGELVILNCDFELISDRFANPRNATAGIMNRKDYDKSDIGCITFIAYTILGDEYTKRDQFEFLKIWGFDVASNTELLIDGDLVDNLISFASSDFDYGIDGVVICSPFYKNEEKYRPDACVAFKLNQQIAQTRIIDVEWGIDNRPSKDGFFTPIGIVQPIELGGSTVSRVTLHNLDFIAEKGIKYGSLISLVKSGDIIPKVIDVIDNPTGSIDIELPLRCPCCGCDLVRDGINLRCKNKECKDQVIYQIMHFIKKLGVKSASFKTLDNFGIHSFDKLLSFRPNTKYKSEVKLYEELLNKVFTRDEKTLFCALNFHGLSEKLLTKIVDFFGVEAAIWSGQDGILYKTQTLPEGIGDITFDKFLSEREENKKILSKIKNDSRYSPIKQVETVKTNSNGMSVCFTGALNTMSRTEASKLAESVGYKVASGISKKLTYLVTNDTESGSSKNKKAKELGVQVIDEETFLKLVKPNNDIETDVFNM